MNSTTFTIPTLETERLRLRAIKLSDFEPEAEFYASDRAAYVGGQMPREQVWRWLASVLGHWTFRGFGFFGVEEKSTGRYLGHVGPWFPEGWPEREIGWTMVNGAEGHGFAFEAATAARRWAYDTLGWDTAISMILHGNTRSIALARRLGATLERDFEHERFGPCHIYRHPAPEALANA